MKFKIEFELDFKDQETLKMLLENHTIEELTQNGYCFARSEEHTSELQSP